MKMSVAAHIHINNKYDFALTSWLSLISSLCSAVEFGTDCCMSVPRIYILSEFVRPGFTKNLILSKSIVISTGIPDFPRYKIVFGLAIETRRREFFVENGGGLSFIIRYVCTSTLFIFMLS